MSQDRYMTNQELAEELADIEEFFWDSIMNEEN